MPVVGSVLTVLATIALAANLFGILTSDWKTRCRPKFPPYEMSSSLVFVVELVLLALAVYAVPGTIAWVAIRRRSGAFGAGVAAFATLLGQGIVFFLRGFSQVC